MHNFRGMPNVSTALNDISYIYISKIDLILYPTCPTLKVYYHIPDNFTHNTAPPLLLSVKKQEG